jgi:Ca-activated chloride channel family protein
MEFVYPQFFWVMLVPFAIFVSLVVTNKDRVSRIFSPEILKRLRAESESLPNYIRNIVLFFAIFLMLVALARPVIKKGEKNIELKGVTAVVALDISGSMRSKDIYPSRLEFAKTKVKEFLDFMPTDDIAITAFAHTAFVLSPFTSDKATLKQLIDGLNDDYINLVSTNFDSIGELATKMLKNKKQKILVIFSDGGDKESLKNLPSILKQGKITLYAVLVGTKKGAPVLDKKGRPVKKRDGTIAITQMDEELIKIAKDSGGGGFVAGYGKADMIALANKIHSDFNSRHKGKIKIKEQIELFYYPLSLALFLLLIGFSSMPRDKNWYKFWKKRVNDD